MLKNTGILAQALPAFSPNCRSYYSSYCCIICSAVARVSPCVRHVRVCMYDRTPPGKYVGLAGVRTVYVNPFLGDMPGRPARKRLSSSRLGTSYRDRVSTGSTCKYAYTRTRIARLTTDAVCKKYIYVRQNTKTEQAHPTLHSVCAGASLCIRIRQKVR